MTRATERWQERMRYAEDTGVMFAAPRTRLVRPGRLLLIGVLGVGSWLLFFTDYPSQSLTTLASARGSVETRQNSTPPARHEPRKRSFTPQNGIEKKPDAPASPRNEPSSQHLAATALDQRAAPLTHPDPVTTGAISGIKPKGIRASGTHHLDHVSVSRPERVKAQKPEKAAQVVKRQTMRQARLSSDAEKGAGIRRIETKPQPVATKLRPERILAATPARTATVCLYFVLCF